MAYFSTASLGRFGVEVDCDLSVPLDETGAAALRDLLYREKLLVFHGQSLSEEEQRRIVGHFGNTLSPDEDHRDLSLEGSTGRCALAYHGDVVFVPKPYGVLSLYGLDIDEQSGTATRFVNGVIAAAKLPAGLRARLAKLTATAVFPRHVSRRDVPFEVPAFLPQLSRPVLWPHPVTGEDILLVFELYTSRIDGMTQAESDALLEELFARLYHEAEVQQHVWRTGDLVMWDNLAIQHGRAEQLTARRRELRRIVAAEQSIFAQCPQLVRDDPKFIAWTKGTAEIGSESAALEFSPESQ